MIWLLIYIASLVVLAATPAIVQSATGQLTMTDLVVVIAAIAGVIAISAMVVYVGQALHNSLEKVITLLQKEE